MGHVAKADGRVSEAEIAAARKVMAELRLNGAQIHAAIEHFTRGKNPTSISGHRWSELREACALVPNCCACSWNCRCAPRSKASTCRGRPAPPSSASPLCSRCRAWNSLHIEAVLRIRREQFRAGGNGGGQQQGQGRAGIVHSQERHAASTRPTRSSRWIRRRETRKSQRLTAGSCRKHHPDKLKANGLPESMLEHAKQRTQQIIEAYDLVKAARGMT